MPSDTEERTIAIGGIRVHFPCKPYPSQLSMMAKIISGIEKQQNCLLESPTGTGKSLALLCSAIAWLQAHKAKLDKEAQEKKLELPEELDPSATCGCKCHLSEQKVSTETVKTEPVKPVQGNVEVPEDRTQSTSNDANDSAEIADDDDFKPAQRSFRTPSTNFHQARKRSHISINYEESTPKNDPNSSTIGSDQPTASGTWKMEITNPLGKEYAEKLEEHVPTNQILDCGKCECAELVRFYMERQVEKIRYPRIYYGTRTHRQLSQITKELSRTAYRHTKMTLLAAKRHTCVHPAVSVAKDVNESCRQLLDGPQCKYNEKSRSVSQASIASTVLNVAWDLEDLIGVCRESSACPYFAARELREGAEIIFCPYNYLIDPNIRSTMEIDLNGDIVILDEAHNVEDSARSAASYEISDKQLSAAMAEMDTLISMNRSLDDYVNLKKVCQKILDVIDETKSSMQQTDFDSTSKTYSGTEIVIMLQRMGCAAENLKKLRSHLNNTLDDADEQISTKKMKLSNASQSVLKGLFQVLDYIYMDGKKFLDDYRMAVTRTTAYSALEGSNTWLNSRKSRKNMSHVFTLHLWCLNPAVAFSDMAAARSVVLTSGTLAPIQTFQSELGLPFPIQLEANHVITSNQVWVGVLPRGPRNKPLLASYQNSETLDFQDEVGRVILDVCKTVPHGILCFVSSYKMLEKLRNRWTDTGLWNDMEQVKGVYSEPRGSDPTSFEEVISDYYGAVKHSEMTHNESSLTGGLLFAVCRGKLSEGIDFSNNKARAVLVIGIPYPNVKDTLVNLKRDYNNKHHVKRGLLSGSQWYEIQAFRALNQALGRCIRHRHDWGALILIDERFSKSEKYTKGLSKWLRTRVQHFPNYKEAQDSLQCFAEYRKNAPSPSQALETSSLSLSQHVDVSLHSPGCITPTNINDNNNRPGTSKHPAPQSSTPIANKSRTSTLARTLIAAQSEVTPIRPLCTTGSATTDGVDDERACGDTERATGAVGIIGRTAPKTKRGIVYIDLDDSLTETNPDGANATETARTVGPKRESGPSSPLLFDSEPRNDDGPDDRTEAVGDRTIEYAMDVRGGDGTLANVVERKDEEVDSTRQNVRLSAKKSAPSASKSCPDAAEAGGVAKRKSGSESNVAGKGLNVRRSKRRKVNDAVTVKKEKRNVQVLGELCCPYCGETLITGDRVRQVDDADCPALVDRVFNANSSAGVYQLLDDGPCPNTVESARDGYRHNDHHDNSHYSEADGCCVQLFQCKQCTEGDYDRDGPAEPVGFVVRLTDGRRPGLIKGKVWLVV